MTKPLAAWQYILLLLLFPPIGACAICVDPSIPLPFKVLAVGCCIAIILFLLTLRLSDGQAVISAQAIG